MMMTQRDYIRRGQPVISQYNKIDSRKKKNHWCSASRTIAVIITAVLMTFTSYSCIIAHHKKEKFKTLQDNKVNDNNLPQKPEKHWRYIKELENRQPSIRPPIEFSADGKSRILN